MRCFFHRPDYKFLNVLKRQFPNTPILGLTATATSAVIEDVKTILRIPTALLFKAGSCYCPIVELQRMR